MDFFEKLEALKRARTNARARLNYQKDIEKRRQQTRESKMRQRAADPEKLRRQTREGMVRAYARDPQKFIQKARDYDVWKKAADPLQYNDDERLKANRWRANNLDHARASDAARQRRLRQTDIQFNLASVLRSRLSSAVRGRRAGSAVRDLGCTLPELKAHLEEQFESGMSWDNYGQWHIDHKIPLALFDLTDRDQLLRAVHHSNLQPKWALDNLKKGIKLEPPSLF